MRIQADGSLLVGTTDGGSSGAGDIVASAIFLGGNQAANELDDYEEGTWTPAVEGSSTVGTWSASSANTGFYTKVGNLVTCYFSLHGSLSGASGSYALFQLPFTSSNTNGSYKGAVTFGYVDNPNINIISSGAYIPSNWNEGYFTYRAAASTSQGYHTPGHFSSGVHYIGTAVYRV
jgi:hypothetical protein